MFSKIHKLIYVSFLLLFVLFTSSISYAFEDIDYNVYTNVSGTASNVTEPSSLGGYSRSTIYNNVLNYVNGNTTAFDNMVEDLKSRNFIDGRYFIYKNTVNKYICYFFGVSSSSSYDFAVVDHGDGSYTPYILNAYAETVPVYCSSATNGLTLRSYYRVGAYAFNNGYFSEFVGANTSVYSCLRTFPTGGTYYKVNWTGSYIYKDPSSGGDVNPSNLLTNDDYYSILNYINSSDIVKNSLSSSNNTDFFIVYKFYSETFDDYTFDVYFYDKKTILGQYVSQLTSEDEKFYRIRRREISNFTEFWDNYILGENWQVDFDHFVMSYSTQSKEVTDFYFSSYKNGQTMPLFNYEKEPIVFTTKTIQFYDSVPDVSNSIWMNQYDSSKNIAGFIVTNPSDPNEVISPDIRPSITDNDLNVGNVFYNTSSFNQYFSTISSLFSSPNAQWIFSSINTLFTTFGSYILMCCVLVFITRII